MNVLKMLGDGQLKMGAPRIGMGIVDVRDVADVHFKAGFSTNAQGRYITSAHDTDLLRLASVLSEKYGDKFPLPKKALPKWLVMLVGPFTNKLFTRKYIKNNVDVDWKTDNSKVRDELGITFKPLKETMEDSFQVLVNEGILTVK